MANNSNSKVDFYRKMLEYSNSCTSETDIQIDVLNKMKRIIFYYEMNTVYGIV